MNGSPSTEPGRFSPRRLGRLVLGLFDRWEARHRRAAGLEAVRGHHLHARGLGPQSIVVDLGANRGEFSREVRRRWRCRCWALEPNPELAESIGAGEGLVVEQLAIASGARRARLILDENPEAHHLWRDPGPPPPDAESLWVQTTTLDALAKAHGLERIDVLKLDVEGAELEVLESLGDRLDTIGQITVEFHDFLPGFSDAERLAAIRRRLRRAGFFELVASWPRGDHSDVLFLRWPGELSAAERFHIELLGRGVLPLRRLLERLRREYARRARRTHRAGAEDG